MKKKERPIKKHIELRKNAGWDKESKKRVDALALVETRTGVTLRWADNSEWGRKVLEKEMN